MPSRHKTIAKNTMILYIRMFVVTIVSLYTSRVVLQTLGVSDFGIFNLAGSLISFFAVLNGAMSSSVQRFLNIELGRGDKQAYSNAFNIGIEIHFFLAVLILIIGESVGLYIFIHWLNIPSDRTYAGLIVYQTALLSSVTTIFRTPYNAYIIANEKVSFFAYISIFETVAKFIMIVSLVYQPYDNLIVYAFSIMLINIILLIIYMGYIYKILEGPKYEYVSYRTDLFKRMTMYSSWNFLGNVSYVFTWQGINMMLNIFHGVTLNAAMGVSSQVANTISSFTANFQIAYKPAIIQTYVQDKCEFEMIICKASKFSFLLLFIILYPLYFNIDYVLDLWLGVYPEYTPAFLKVLLWSLLVSSLSLPLYNALEANGNISKYNITTFLLQPLLLLYSFIVLYLGISPVFAVASHLIGAILLALFLFHQMIVNQIIRYKLIVNQVYIRAFCVVLTSSFISIFIRVGSEILRIGLMIFIALLIVLIVGLSHYERKMSIKYLVEKYFFKCN